MKWNLGYYDYDQGNKGKKGGHFLSGLGGAIVGGLIVTLALPTLSNNGLLPYSVQPKTEVSIQENNNTGNIATQKVSLEVSTDVTNAVKKAGDAVVGITNLQSTSFWTAQGESQETGTGSGVIYKKSGDKAYIVTNNHVIEGADQLDVTLADGTKLPARLLGSDPWTDLAVIEVDGKKLKR